MVSNGDGHAKWQGKTGQRVQDNEEQLKDHETRISSLERFKYIVIGGLAVLSIISGAGGLGSLISLLGGA